MLKGRRNPVALRFFRTPHCAAPKVPLLLSMNWPFRAGRFFPSRLPGDGRNPTCSSLINLFITNTPSPAADVVAADRSIPPARPRR